MSVYKKLEELNIKLPQFSAPAAAYVLYAISGKQIFLSGHLPKKDGKVWTGRLGENVTTEEGSQAARSIAIDLISTLQEAAGGDLNKIKRIVKVVSLVNSAPSFTDPHVVTNGCSELFNAVFGEKGKHARSAFGVAQLPMGACVEIEIVAELE